MASGRSELVLRGFGRLFGVGTASGLGSGRLLERFAAEGDETAFEALVTRHGPMVLGTCRRMLADPHDVDDAFQATFLVLARKAGSIQDADRLGPWLHGVARRVAARSRALSYRRSTREHPAGDEPAAESPDLLEHGEIRAALDEELAKLPEKYRAPLVLCYLEGLTHDEAADALRWPVGTVRSRLAGGRDRLRIRLTRRGLHPSAAVPALLVKGAMPAALLARTVRVATTAGSVPTHILNLAKGALIAMAWSNLKMVAALGLMAGLTVGGAAATAQQGGAGTPATTPAVDPTDQAKRDRVGQVAEAIQVKIERDRLDAKIKEVKAIEDAIPAAATQLENLKRERDRGLLEVADLKKKLGIVQPPDALASDRPLNPDQFEAEMRRIRAETLVVEKKIKEVEAEQKTTLGPLMKTAGDLAARDFELTQRWKKQVADATEVDIDDRIKRLEKQITDQAAVIRTLRESGNPPASSPPAKGETVPPPTPDAPNRWPGAEANPMATATKRADPQPIVHTFLGDPTFFAVVSAERDRVTMIDSQTQRRETFRLPKPATEIQPIDEGRIIGLLIKGQAITRAGFFDRQDKKWYERDLEGPVDQVTVYSGPSVRTTDTVVGLQMIGPKLTRLEVFDTREKKWTTQDFREPIKGAAYPRMTRDTAVCQMGRTIYAYSAIAKKWTVLELKRDARETQHGGGGAIVMPTPAENGRMVIPDGDAIHIYDVKTGEWTHVDIKDEPAK